MAALPLEGVLILDLAHVYAGPTCSRILSDLGADVIKIEGLRRPDLVRNILIADNNIEGDFFNRGSYFAIRNAGKRSLTLNLDEAQGVATFKRLLPHADVVTESFTPRVMRNFGLDYESLRAIKPDIIMISLSGYGQTGPWSNFTAYGMGLEPASGISRLTGYADGPPLRTGISFTDPLTGIVGAGAVLTALHHRRRTGQGQYIDLSEQEAAMPLVGQAFMDWVMNRRLWERRGNRSDLAAPQGCYRCRGRDDWLVISIRNDEEWAAFCRAVGHPEWTEDDRFADVLGRHRHHDELDTLITEWTQSQDKYEAMHLLQRAGVIAAAVLNGKEVLFDPHIKARHLYDIIDLPGVGRRPIPRATGAHFSRFEAKAKGYAPRLGEHNVEVLKELGGMTDEEIAELEQAGVIGSIPQATPIPASLLAQIISVPMERLVEQGSVLAYEPDYKEQLKKLEDT